MALPRFAIVILLFIFIALILGQGFRTPTSQLGRLAANPKLAASQITINKIPFSVTIARTPGERGRGLSGRPRLGEKEGMLFVFFQDARPAFWMKDMKFPIDILWIDRNGRIAEITRQVSPETFPNTFSPRQPIRYVLEIGAGVSDFFNINPGDQILP